MPLEEKTLYSTLLKAMVNRFKYDFRYIHVFIILFKQNDNRLSAALWDMLNLFQSMFGPDFWKNVILGATHWHFSHRMVGQYFTEVSQ